jgi:hypothetical protein
MPRRTYSQKRAAEGLEGPSAAVCNNYRASPCRTLAYPSMSYQTATTLRREQQGASCEAPCCRLQLLPCPTTPFLAGPHLSPPDHARSALQREQQREANSPVLPSAAINKPGHTRPNRALPLHTLPKHTAPFHNHSQREQQRGLTPSVLPSAAVAVSDQS